MRNRVFREEKICVRLQRNISNSKKNLYASFIDLENNDGETGWWGVDGVGDDLCYLLHAVKSFYSTGMEVVKVEGYTF